MKKSDIDISEYERLKEKEKRQKEKFKRQNAHTNTIYDRISFTVPKGQKELIKSDADAHGMTVNQYIQFCIAAMRENMKDETTTGAEENKSDLELPFL